MTTIFPTRLWTYSIVIAFGITTRLSAAVLPESMSEAMKQAAAYLKREAEVWPDENGCYSCHNNGDAARVLFGQHDFSSQLQGERWKTMLNWYVQPEKWLSAKTDEVSLSPALYTIQFGKGLLSAETSGLLAPTQQQRYEVGRLVADHQNEQGYWPIEPAGTVGSPGTYGNTLGVAFALDILSACSDATFETNIGRANQWLFSQIPSATVDIAGTLLALKHSTNPTKRSIQSRLTEQLIQRQSQSGGWGPYQNRWPEVFDTSIAMIALAELSPDPESSLETPLVKGVEFLLEIQDELGAWPETTRPTGGTSYAQHISTTAWALQALQAAARSTGALTQSLQPLGDSK